MEEPSRRHRTALGSPGTCRSGAALCLGKSKICLLSDIQTFQVRGSRLPKQVCKKGKELPFVSSVVSSMDRVMCRRNSGGVGGRPGPTMGTAPPRSTSATWVLPDVEGPQGQTDQTSDPRTSPKGSPSRAESPQCGLPRGPISPGPSHPGRQSPLLFLWQRGGLESSTTPGRDLLRNLGARRSSR